MTKTQAVALAVAIALSPLSLMPAAIHHHAPVIAVASQCMEDQPCWDCATMGNLVCGPVAHGVAAADGGVPGPDMSRQFDDTAGSDPADDAIYTSGYTN